MPDQSPEGALPPINNEPVVSQAVVPESKGFMSAISKAVSKLIPGKKDSTGLGATPPSVSEMGSSLAPAQEVSVEAATTPNVVESSATAPDSSQEAIANNLESTLQQASADSAQRANTINNPVNSFAPSVGPMVSASEQGPAPTSAPTTEKAA